MASFQDILSTLCSSVEQQHSTGFQTIYLVTDTKEAQLAVDILVSYGFDAKAYPEANATKLYITQPQDGSNIDDKLNAALAYARSIKGIKQSLDALYGEDAGTIGSNDYNVTFSNSPMRGKQIVIQLPPASNAPMQQQAAPAPAAARPAAASAPKAAAGGARKKKSLEMSAGPEVGKMAYPGYVKTAKIDQNTSTAKQWWLYVTGNSPVFFTSVLLFIIVVGVMFTFVVMSKSFLCPDFARDKKKNTSWFCQTMDTGGEDPSSKPQIDPRIVPPPPAQSQ